jgi:hypothetical protein
MQYRSRTAYEIYKFLTRKVATSCLLVRGIIVAHSRWKPKKNYGHFNSVSYFCGMVSINAVVFGFVYFPYKGE